jgi:hypothetical protein
LTELEAAARRRSGLDIVVRGPDKAANKRLAKMVEELVGRLVSPPELPHASAGALALPHYHQLSRVPPGHSFYEVDNRKARKMP